MTKRILIVEDERHIGIGLRFNCEAEGYEAALVEDGPSALRLLSEQPGHFHLIILDLMLPGMSGYAVLEKLRDAGEQTPVLILSARTLSEDKVRGFDLGADQYLTKPFELPELISRVRNLLSRHPSFRPTAQKAAASGDDIYEFDGATVNFTRHEVRVRGDDKALTSLEFKLVKCFVENEGAVLTRNELLDKVWGSTPHPPRAPSTISSSACATTSKPTPPTPATSCPSAEPATNSSPGRRAACVASVGSALRTVEE